MAEKSRANFIFAHFLDLEIAHKHGTESKEVREAAKNIDYAVKKLYEKDENILLFSDHGMNDIKNEIDILYEIKKLNLKFGKDLIYIIGSTTVEFWFKNDKAKNKVINMLKEKSYGKIIRQDDFNIATNSDIIFLADFQTAFYPNFFSKYHFKAMHGWNPKEQKTYYLLKNSKINGWKNAKMIDFLPTLIQIMNLPKIRCDGKSLL